MFDNFDIGKMNKLFCEMDKAMSNLDQKLAEVDYQVNNPGNFGRHSKTNFDEVRKERQELFSEFGPIFKNFTSYSQKTTKAPEKPTQGPNVESQQGTVKVTYKVIEEDENVKVYFVLPGFEKSEISLSASVKNVMLKTNKVLNDDSLIKNVSQVVELDDKVNPHTVTAKLNNGILTVTIDKDIEKAVKIDIE